ncbi:peptidylprolyl isomerase [Curvibacter sp. RS43]|jgi:peptidyl-prolyl cis-trans isomerase SurA|uniref:Chaperone SurA n=1 Tax=Curvibacter microcysteis TaxID=3026419 RepID=A0ABT5MJF7_9BURK|nr:MULTISPECIES: peptidylprolyl isomerase [unclassified Curvibacter]MDD0811016.1 peptidylprolyl isomerase [Curvibacter sp. RS43]MDD0816029.1 peptidylprolyl isomerase [Curvibacter sp. HBC28]
MTIKRVSVLALACLTLLTTQSQAQGIRLKNSAQPSSIGMPAPNAAPALSGPQPADFIVAVVNSEPITNNEVRARAARALQQLAQQGVRPPPESELIAQVLERMISEKAQVQLAVEQGLKVEDGAVDQAFQTIARQNQLSVAELQRRMEADNVSVKQMREDLRNQILLSRLREREVEPRAKVTELEIDQLLVEQATRQSLAQQEINLAQVLIAVPDEAPADTVANLKALADRVAAQARAGIDFASLARDYSNGTDRARGGEMGLRAAELYPELFVMSVQGVPVNGIAGPIRSGAGFHVLKVIDRQGAKPAAMMVPQSRARHILLRTGPKLNEAAAINLIKGYRQRIVSGAALFADLAKEHSQDGSAKQGGDLGWVNPGQFVPEFEEVMNSLEPGQISEPVVSRFGVHLIQLMERREVPMSQRDQRDLARNALREKKMEEAYVNWSKEVRDRAYVEMREAPL